MQPKLRVMGDDIISGNDFLGVLLMGHDYKGQSLSMRFSLTLTRMRTHTQFLFRALFLLYIIKQNTKSFISLLAWWIGSLLDIHEARELVPHQNATTLQVAISMTAGLLYKIEKAAPSKKE
jgi:homospermidine synthase